ncbi:hypothetical protein WJT86_12090 [Microvirga sp. W0021]|uniref:Sel1 repeat family protein n=1 Tax=Hohaiivirga grylli TaxID=3133970 RepID=A0ABV0BPU6_9HYPH
MSNVLKLKSGFEKEPDLEKLTSAFQAMKDGKNDLSRKILQELIDDGSLWSLVYLGDIYYSELNYDKALEYYSLAAIKGSISGEFYRARLFYTIGKYNEAFLAFSKLSEKGLPTAKYWLYMLYRNKYINNLSKTKAISLLFQAADSGHLYAQREKAMLYLKGKMGFWRIPIGLFFLVKMIQNAVKISKLDDKVEYTI